MTTLLIISLFVLIVGQALKTIEVPFKPENMLLPIPYRKDGYYFMTNCDKDSYNEVNKPALWEFINKFPKVLVCVSDDAVGGDGADSFPITSSYAISFSRKDMFMDYFTIWQTYYKDSRFDWQSPNYKPSYRKETV